MDNNIVAILSKLFLLNWPYEALPTEPLCFTDTKIEFLKEILSYLKKDF